MGVALAMQVQSGAAGADISAKVLGVNGANNGATDPWVGKNHCKALLYRVVARTVAGCCVDYGVTTGEGLFDQYAFAMLLAVVGDGYFIAMVQVPGDHDDIALLGGK